MSDNVINVLNTPFHEIGKYSPVEYQEVELIMNQWRKSLEHCGSQDYGAHVETLVSKLNDISHWKAADIATDDVRYVLPLDFGFDTIIAMLAFYKAYSGAVSTSRQQGILMVINSKDLMRKLWWFHNHHLKFDFGIHILDDGERVSDLDLKPSVLVMSADQWFGLSDEEQALALEFYNTDGQRNLMI